MRGSLIAALACAASLAVAATAQPVSDYDLVIRNGRVLDGAGNPWFLADIAIKDGRIARLGVVDGHGSREIDARGLYVSPGWIDMQDQSGKSLIKNGRAETKLMQGVTTLIAGEGGAPVPSAQLGNYFSQLQRQGISVNFGTYYGATQARREVIGDVAGTPTAPQLAAMKAHVVEAMNAGALGVSSALIYPPASFQSTDELIAIVKAAAPCRGIYATHIRDESQGLLKALSEAAEIGRQAGVPVEVYHLKAAYAPTWGTEMPKAAALIEAARASGVDMAANMYLYTAGGTGLSSTIPNWVYSEGAATAMERLKDPKIRARLKREVRAGDQPGWSNLVQASGGWSGVVLSSPHNPKYDIYRNRSIADIAKALGREPEDVAWDIVAEAMPERATARYFMISDTDIDTAIRYPWVSLGSDAGIAEDPAKPEESGLPHPRAYGNAPRLIAEYVRKRHLLTLEDAVRKMTSWPAARLHLADRGLIRAGFAADLTIFDYDRIQDRATYEQPSLPPEGIRYVLVNGKIVMVDGKHTGEMPGAVIKSSCKISS